MLDKRVSKWIVNLQRFSSKFWKNTNSGTLPENLVSCLCLYLHVCMCKLCAWWRRYPISLGCINSFLPEDDPRDYSVLLTEARFVITGGSSNKFASEWNDCRWINEILQCYEDKEIWFLLIVQIWQSIFLERAKSSEEKKSKRDVLNVFYKGRKTWCFLPLCYWIFP